MIIGNIEPTESAITFTTHSTDSDNIVLLSEKENYTHGTLCSVSSIDIWVVGQSPTTQTPFAGWLVSWQEGFGGTCLFIYMLYPLEKQIFMSSLLSSEPPFIHQERSTVLSWIPPKVTMLHGSQWRKFFKQNYYEEQVSESCLPN